MAFSKQTILLSILSIISFIILLSIVYWIYLEGKFDNALAIQISFISMVISVSSILALVFSIYQYIKQRKEHQQKISTEDKNNLSLIQNHIKIVDEYLLEGVSNLEEMINLDMSYFLVDESEQYIYVFLMPKGKRTVYFFNKLKNDNIDFLLKNTNQSMQESILLILRLKGFINQITMLLNSIKALQNVSDQARKKELIGIKNGFDNNRHRYKLILNEFNRINNK